MRLSLIVILLAAAAFCQDRRGVILGRVTDSSGAATVDVDVRVTNRDTGVRATARSNNAGSFNIPFLLPGVYTV